MWLYRSRERASYLIGDIPSPCIDEKWSTCTVTTDKTSQGVHMLLKRAPKTHSSIRDDFKSSSAFVSNSSLGTAVNSTGRFWCAAEPASYYILINRRLKMSAEFPSRSMNSLLLYMFLHYLIVCFLLYLFLGLGFSFLASVFPGSDHLYIAGSE